jgi:phosphoserine aminotransferase
MKIHNFSAGPGILPAEVLQEAAQGVLNYQDTGLSLIEMSHRGPEFVDVMDQAVSLVRELLGLNDDYEVVFLQGGASLQFYMAPLNLLSSEGYAAYLDTGTWAANAIKEAKRVGRVEVIGSSRDKNYAYLPEFSVPSDADYLHYTSNNTIFGTQFQNIPDSPVPLVCDMSSDMFSKPIDASRFSMIYAGAQKNMGPAGTTLVVVKKDMLGKTGRSLPTMLDYQIHIEKESMFNTPPVFPIFVSMLTLKWLKNNGGLTWIGELNRLKSSCFYEALDSNPLFTGTVEKSVRSWMNATFLLNDTRLEPTFESMLEERGISGLKGHRSVGGYRASMYNALPLESVQVLVQAMNDFAQQNG